MPHSPKRLKMVVIHWVDIERGTFQRYADARVDCLYDGTPGVTAAVPHAAGGFLLTLQDRLVHLLERIHNRQHN